MAISASRSSSEIWFEFRFDAYDPAKKAATATTITNPIINPLNVDFLQISFHYHFDLTQNLQNSFEFVQRPSILNRIGNFTIVIHH